MNGQTNEKSQSCHIFKNGGIVAIFHLDEIYIYVRDPTCWTSCKPKKSMRPYLACRFHFRNLNLGDREVARSKPLEPVQEARIWYPVTTWLQPCTSDLRFNLIPTMQTANPRWFGRLVTDRSWSCICMQQVGAGRLNASCSCKCVSRSRAVYTTLGLEERACVPCTRCHAHRGRPAGRVNGPRCPRHWSFVFHMNCRQAGLVNRLWP